MLHHAIDNGYWVFFTNNPLFEQLLEDVINFFATDLEKTSDSALGAVDLVTA